MKRNVSQLPRFNLISLEHLIHISTKCETKCEAMKRNMTEHGIVPWEGDSFNNIEVFIEKITHWFRSQTADTVTETKLDSLH